MDFVIDEDVSVLVAAVADFLKRRDDAPAIASAAATGPAADRARWSALCEIGLPALRMAEPHGVGASVLEAASVAEQLGAVLLPEPATSSAVLAKLLADHRRSPQLLEALLAGSTVASFAAFDRVQLSTTGAVTGPVQMFDDGITDVVAVPATLENDAAAALVILDGGQLPPVTQRQDVDPSRPAVWYQLDAVRPVDVLRLDEAALDVARMEATVLMASELVGGMQAVLTATVGYVQERHQFGRSIGSFQAVKHRLADMYIVVEQARAAVQFAGIGCDSGLDSVETDVAAAARWVPCAAIELFDNAIHLHGAMGYAWELDIHLHLRRALVTRELLSRPGTAS